MKLSLETMVSSIGRKVVFLLNASKRVDMGVSVINCYWAARRNPRIAKLISRAVPKSANMTFVDATKSSLDEKICLNVGALLVSPVVWPVFLLPVQVSMP